MTISCWILFRMRNILHQICRENDSTRFVLDNSFPKTVPFMRWCWKIWWSQRGHVWQYGGALVAGLIRLHARRYTPAPRALTPFHPHARACRRTQKYVIFIVFPRQQCCCEGAPMVCCTYIASLVCVCKVWRTLCSLKIYHYLNQNKSFIY